MAAAGLPPSLLRACQVILCGGVLGFLASLTMVAVPGKRSVPVPRQGPCHSMEDAKAPLPLCPEGSGASSKSEQLPIQVINESAVRVTIERRQERVDEAERELEARNKADEAEKERLQAELADKRRAARRKEAPPGEEVGELPSSVVQEMRAEPTKSRQEKLEEQQRQKEEKQRQEEKRRERAAAKEAQQRQEEKERERAAAQEAQQRQEEKERERAAAQEKQRREEKQRERAAAKEEKLRQKEKDMERAAAKDSEGDCHTAVKGDACFKHVVWSRDNGVREHPEWYPGLTSSSSLADFQYVLHVTGPKKSKCPMPCIDKKERLQEGGCRTASPGEECYKQTLWAKTNGVYEHPEWYGKLTNSSSFEEFQDFLRTSGSGDCPRPCAPSLQMLL